MRAHSRACGGPEVPPRDRLGSGALHECAHSAAQFIVVRAEDMSPAIPIPNGLSRHVIQLPALAGFHAGLADFFAQHVVVVAHHDAIPGIDDFALVVFNVECHARKKLFIYGVSVLLGPIVCHCEKGSTQRIKVGHGWRIGMRCGFDGGLLFGRSERSCNSPRVPYG